MSQTRSFICCEEKVLQCLNREPNVDYLLINLQTVLDHTCYT